MNSGYWIRLLKYDFVNRCLIPKESTGSRFIIWSFYDCLEAVSGNYEDGPAFESSVFQGQEQSSYLFPLTQPIDTFGGPFEFSDTHPIISILQFNLHDSVNKWLHDEAVSWIASRMNTDACEPFLPVEQLSDIASGVKDWCGGLEAATGIHIFMLGTLGSYDLVCVMRSASIADIFSCVRELRSAKINSILPGNTMSKLIQEEYLMAQPSYQTLGISQNALFECSEPGMVKWRDTEKWNQLRVAIDINIRPGVDDAIIHDYLKLYANPKQHLTLQHAERYDLLVEMMPNPDISSLFHKMLQGADNISAHVTLFQTHWMQLNENTEKNTALVSSTPLQQFNSDRAALQQKEIYEDGKIIGDTISRCEEILLTRTVPDGTTFHPLQVALKQITWLVQSEETRPLFRKLFDQLSTLLLVIEKHLYALKASGERTNVLRYFDIQPYDKAIQSVWSLVDQLSSGNSNSIESLGGNVYFTGSRAKVLLGTQSLVHHIQDAIVESYYASYSKEIDYIEFITLLSLGDIIQSHLLFDYTQYGDWIGVFELPNRKKHVHPTIGDYPLIWHEINHYIPPVEREKRNNVIGKTISAAVLSDVLCQCMQNKYNDNNICVEVRDAINWVLPNLPPKEKSKNHKNILQKALSLTVMDIHKDDLLNIRNVSAWVECTCEQLCKLKIDGNEAELVELLRKIRLDYSVKEFSDLPDKRKRDVTKDLAAAYATEKLRRLVPIFEAYSHDVFDQFVVAIDKATQNTDRDTICRIFVEHILQLTHRPEQTESNRKQMEIHCATILNWLCKQMPNSNDRTLAKQIQHMARTIVHASSEIHADIGACSLLDVDRSTYKSLLDDMLPADGMMSDIALGIRLACVGEWYDERGGSCCNRSIETPRVDAAEKSFQERATASVFRDMFDYMKTTFARELLCSEHHPQIKFARLVYQSYQATDRDKDKRNMLDFGALWVYWLLKFDSRKKG